MVHLLEADETNYFVVDPGSGTESEDPDLSRFWIRRTGSPKIRIIGMPTLDIAALASKSYDVFSSVITMIGSGMSPNQIMNLSPRCSRILDG